MKKIEMSDAAATKLISETPDKIEEVEMRAEEIQQKEPQKEQKEQKELKEQEELEEKSTEKTKEEKEETEKSEKKREELTARIRFNNNIYGKLGLI